jgi:hypothetical protein
MPLSTPQDDAIDSVLPCGIRGSGRLLRAAWWSLVLFATVWLTISYRVGFGGSFPPLPAYVLVWTLVFDLWRNAATDYPAIIRRIPCIRRQVLYNASNGTLLALVLMGPAVPRSIGIAFYVLMIVMVVVSIVDLAISKA